MRDKLVVWVALAALLVGPGVSRAAAQGGTSGSITGTVSDNTGAVLPGVTVTSTSPAQMGAQTAVTNDQGIYRFPNVAPGVYTLTFDLGGFSKVIREDLQINIGFTATVNTTLVVASLQESVVVTGESPIVDIKNTHLQNNFTEESLKNIPNARDIWSVIGAAPGMRIGSFDVGGSRAGTQTGFTAFGQSGQIRAQLEGVNTTEGTGAAGFYYNYGAFQELQFSVDSNDASAATPGVQLNAVMKSGGNKFKGDFYYDYENQSMQGRNVSQELTNLGLGQGQRTLSYRDPTFNIGGPIMKDKLWYFFSLRDQKSGVLQAGFPVEDPNSEFEFATILTNGTYKVTYQLSQNNKLSHFVEIGRKQQPHRGASSSLYKDAVFFQDSTSYAGNLEWSNVASQTFFQSATISTFGYNWPNIPYGPNLEFGDNLSNRRLDDGTSRTAGSASADRNNRRRLQFDWKGNWFKDNWLGGNHNLRMGFTGEREAGFFTDIGFLNSMRLQFNSTGGAADFSTPSRVTLYNSPYSAEDRMTHMGAFIQDQLAATDRITLNLGVRWDYYNVNYPDQDIREAPFRDFFYGGAPLSGVSLPRSPFAGDWKVPARNGIIKYKAAIAPRLGIAWDLSGSGKDVMKVNFGRYFNNPGVAGGQNPVGAASAIFAWNDVNGDKLFTMNELGAFASNAGGSTNTVNPDIGHPYSNDFGGTYERELGRGTSARVGYVYRSSENNYTNIQLSRLGSLYTLALSRPDAGPDGIAGNGDDGPSFTVWDIPTSAAATVPVSRTDQQTRKENRSSSDNIDLTFNKRMSNRFSMVANFLYTWRISECFIQTPNDERTCITPQTEWGFKMYGTYEAPWDIIVTPLLRHQSGGNLGRNVTATGQRVGNITYAAELVGAYRNDNTTILDTRIEKKFKLGGRRGLGLFFDAFNITNSSAVQARSELVARPNVTVDGKTYAVQGFLRPTGILPPRIYRFGFRLDF